MPSKVFPVTGKEVLAGETLTPPPLDPPAEPPLTHPGNIAAPKDDNAMILKNWRRSMLIRFREYH
jgi:hypothetical protein